MGIEDISIRQASLEDVFKTDRKGIYSVKMFQQFFLLLSKNLFVINHHGFGILFSRLFLCLFLAGFILILGNRFSRSLLSATLIRNSLIVWSKSSRMSIRFR